MRRTLSAPPRRVHAARWCACAALALVWGPGWAWADDAPCGAAPATVASGGESLDALRTAAEALVHPLDRPRARALYLAVLARAPEDDEAMVGLARLDAWDGCEALAERGYRAVLRRAPGHVEARAGLADLLMWARRFFEAARVLDQGLALAPLSPELLSRRGRLAYVTGDMETARRALDEARRVSPLDPELRAAEARVFFGQARLGQRAQIFPAGYDDIATTEASGMQRWRRLRLEVGMSVTTRRGGERPTRLGPIPTTIVDGRTSVGAYYHATNGGWVGGSYGFGTPALAVPRHAFAVASATPLGRRLELQLSSALWRYEDDRDVTIVSPALTFALTPELDLTARYWLTSIVRRGDLAGAESVHSLGLRAGWRVAERLTLGAGLTYGVQLETMPLETQLLRLRSAIGSLSAVWLVSRGIGIDVGISLERRESLSSGAVVFGPGGEAGVFTRW